MPISATLPREHKRTKAHENDFAAVTQRSVGRRRLAHDHAHVRSLSKRTYELSARPSRGPSAR
jgi:hypothetical protein